MTWFLILWIYFSIWVWFRICQIKFQLVPRQLVGLIFSFTLCMFSPWFWISEKYQICPSRHLLHLLAVIVYMNALEVICFGKYQNNTIMDFFSLWLPSYAVSHMNWIHFLRTIFLRFSLRIIAGFEDQSLTISSQRTHPYWWEINLQKFSPYLFSLFL